MVWTAPLAPIACWIAAIMAFAWVAFWDAASCAVLAEVTTPMLNWTRSGVIPLMVALPDAWMELPGGDCARAEREATNNTSQLRNMGPPGFNIALRGYTGARPDQD